MENNVDPEQEVEKKENLTDTEVAQPEVDEPKADANPNAINNLKKLQDELAEAKDKYLRLYAEFDNHRRRTSKEKIELIQSGGESILKALLPVADDFDRAEKSFKDKNTKEAEGFFLIQNKFKKVLEQNGIKEMETASGIFNADLHEAITQTPTDDQNKKGKIVEVLEKGYLLNDKVIRHAKVVIGG
jgi:molecular chaperone GrpE